MDGAHDAHTKLATPSTVADVNLHHAILYQQRTSPEDVGIWKASNQTPQVQTHGMKVCVPNFSEIGLGSGHSHPSCNSLDSAVTAVPLGHESPPQPENMVVPSGNVATHHNQNIMGHTGQTSVKINLEPPIPVPTSLPEICQANTEFQSQHRPRSQAFSYIENRAEDLVQEISMEDVIQFSQLIKEPTHARSRSQAFHFITNLAEQEVQGIQTEVADPLQPILEVDQIFLRNDMGGTDWQLDSLTRTYCENVSNSVDILPGDEALLQQILDAPSPVVVNSGSGLSTYKNYAGSPGIYAISDHPGTQSPALEAISSITNIGDIPVPADDQTFKELRQVAPLQKLQQRDREEETLQTGESKAPATASEAPTSTAGKNIHPARKRRSRSKSGPRRERAYERLHPYSDKQEERRRQDAIRAKKCRERNKETKKKLADDYDNVCKQRDNLARELQRMHQREKALFDYLKTKHGLDIAPESIVM